jgi:hypothetical protein
MSISITTSPNGSRNDTYGPDDADGNNDGSGCDDWGGYQNCYIALRLVPKLQTSLQVLHKILWAWYHLLALT